MGALECTSTSQLRPKWLGLEIDARTLVGTTGRRPSPLLVDTYIVWRVAVARPRTILKVFSPDALTLDNVE